MGKFITHKEIAQAKLLMERGDITEEALEELVLAGTPSLWAESKLRDPNDSNQFLRLRPYQHDGLQPCKTIAMRWARQIGKTILLAARIIWEAFTESNINILVYAPRVKHISQIYDYILKMIHDSPDLNAFIVDKRGISKSKVKEPEDSVPKIILSNGTKIMFFHTQSKVAQELIRGTPGDRFFLEEAHYIKDEALSAISGVITDADDPFIWAQSSPRGRNGWFYDFAIDADIHSHHTAMESPKWSKEKERMARLLAPDEGTYSREVLAEWVDDGWSAFTENSIVVCSENAKNKRGRLDHQGDKYLSIGQVIRLPGEVFIGVDWNIASHGTKIIEMKSPDVADTKLLYQNVHSIENPKYTQLTAIDKLFDILDKYKDNDDAKLGAVCLDKGYAATALEVINERLEKDEYKWLIGKIHVVDFGEIIHIPIEEFFTLNPAGAEEVYGEEQKEEQLVKRPMKVFMVSIMTRMMLTGELGIGPIDKDLEKKTLLGELRSVQVEKVSSNGYPVYSKKDLHKFAAVILACYGYFMEHGQLKIVEEGNKKVLRKSEGSDSALGELFNIPTPTVGYTPGAFNNRITTINPQRGILPSVAKQKSFEGPADELDRVEAFIDTKNPSRSSYGWRNTLNRSVGMKGRRSI